MLRRKLYIFNDETSTFEVFRTSLAVRLRRVAGIVAAAAVCMFLYSFVVMRVMGYHPPKTVLLQARNQELRAREELLCQRMEGINRDLLDISVRDNTVYRPIFGMQEIAYDHTGGTPAEMADLLTRRALVQAKSFDEVGLLARRAGEMAACVPNINPVNLASPQVNISSPFGIRFHPVFQQNILHTGIDLRGPVGEPVYATGDGVVESATINFHGYGNCVVIDHGFGYKTRYAHLRAMFVAPGQKVRRGDEIATIGNSGRTTGPHLHYEVIYMGSYVNPWKYLDSGLSSEEYFAMVRPREELRR